MAGVQRGTGKASIITGLLVAAGAVVPMLYASSGNADPGKSVADVVATRSATETTFVTETVVVADPVEIDELPDSVVRVLEEAGNVREESRTELPIPESIVAVLADHEVVLRVAEEVSSP